MPLITSIEPQKKRKNRFNIFLDEEFGFAADENVLLKYNLKISQSLTQSQIEKLIKENELGKLMDQSLRFLSYRPRSEKEVVDYLIGKISQKENIKYSQAKESPLIKQVVLKLKKYKYLDDFEFANWLVRSRIRSKPQGLSLVKFDLEKKGIDDEIINSIIAKYPDQTVLAKRAIEKKLANWQKLPKGDFKKKIYQYLASRGFNFETIGEVFANLEKKH
ncbi:hypothetical protein A2362_02110 [Candidatus Curtissbacteria bacterium RIFOXYB1_FULL_41_59]|uniref:Regulatory protein RecX n=1 Tax=Candidatus Curtissbacteria bacterium RIFOXYA1_FULL_41_14 TaxID=1797737 RepID=A0A1F5HC07_9BACT|nr:MAG: Regulatory protein RecX [Microgenomates group bacterium GW2011_GWC1_40_35]KKR77716.1 MAG: Regulatory protein RecX [Candidatus Curtissbacteria bacterium GW2011_GWD1_40_8]KKS02345.1 MAG: Regulatory protein RecX [Candidatus Curtissbacteria bacterium GW2011_GWC2_41_21]OGD80126.1 MAG: hypothetical protein A2683_03805 [Candidatus Curtissbacteria bacterium RIFCSPHIGHO2_01_FULL_34_40]OGE01724.1 MAG: hypothetical protein A2196_02455 [Candidatus Curtissbacteria bacterium RIFOXYA1_FULL_41_14]OGE0